MFYSKSLYTLRCLLCTEKRTFGGYFIEIHWYWIQLMLFVRQDKYNHTCSDPQSFLYYIDGMLTTIIILVDVCYVFPHIVDWRVHKCTTMIMMAIKMTTVYGVPIETHIHKQEKTKVKPTLYRKWRLPKKKKFIRI